MDWLSVEWIGSLALAYVIGSIPTAYLAGRLVKGKDIREEGDHNAGAGNAYKMIGPRTGLAVGAADIAKGAVAVLVARILTDSVGAQMLSGVAVVVGHSWPAFSGLRGGRGAASAVGVFIALVPMPAIPVGLVSLASLPVLKSTTVAVGIIMVPMALLAWLTGASLAVVVYLVGLPMMVGARHYFSSRKSHRRIQDQAGGQALPQK